MSIEKSEISPTLRSETHQHEPIICMATQQGGAEISMNDKAPTLTASAGMSGNNQPVVCYSVDMGAGKSSCDILTDKAPTLATTHYGEPAVCYAEKRFFHWEEDDNSVSLRAKSGSYGGGAKS